jgi:hypothetical protein
LTIASLHADVVAMTRGASDPTHPPAAERMENLMACVDGLAPKYSGFINYTGILWAHYDEITERLVRSVVGSV